jgi:UDP-N-acetylmuramoylalanine--D-glutamate ligase
VKGTNGKSTTTSLIYHLLKANGFKVQIGGNIGISGKNNLNDLNFKVMDLDFDFSDGYFVLEVSSFQLDLLDQLKFDIGIITNITPDHIDRHGTMDQYILSKLRVFNIESGYNLLGVDSKYTKNLWEKLTNVVKFSTETQLEDGFSLIKGQLTVFNKKKDLLELKNNFANWQNWLCAYAVCCHLKIEPKCIFEHSLSFKPLKHRCEHVGTFKNLTFINDSKATNAESTENALRLLTGENIYWIVGGTKKEEGIDPLEPYFKNINHAFLIGKSSKEFSVTLNGKVEYTQCETLENAIIECVTKGLVSKDEIIILLSPACASYDQWKNFEKRGEFFVEFVKNKYVGF